MHFLVSPLPGSDVYYLGIVDTFFNEAKPRPGEVRTREYELEIWWGQCLYWDNVHDRWSGDGCELLQESTYDTVKCR